MNFLVIKQHQMLE